MDSELAVIIHGGAGRFNAEHNTNKLPGLQEALDAAWSELLAGKPGEFAVAAALRVMEGSEYFNAGYGGYPNVNGIVLMDIGMMRGNLDFISIINLRRVKYPSAVAMDLLQKGRSIMTIWTHELMQELDSAPDFIKERCGVVATHEDLIAPYVLEVLNKRSATEVSDEDDETHGTVGCVVRDAKGRLFAGTSTGGVNLKSNGRVGDTPIIGSGVFADDNIGALSTTGHGESILRSVLSGFIISEMRNALRKNPKAFANSPEALTKILELEVAELKSKSPNKSGAIIVIPPVGDPAYAFCSEMLSFGMRVGTGKKVRKELVEIAR